jgi:hypothetical protein
MFKNNVSKHMYRTAEPVKLENPWEARSVPISEVSSFQGVHGSKTIILGPGEVSLFQRMYYFFRVKIHRFHRYLT